jgi:glycerol-3-phosphate acyltransferase PlsY
MAAVLGHDFSIFLRFRGGKGIATSAGVALALLPPAGIAAMLTWALVAALSRYAALASLVALAAAPIYIAVAGGPPVYVWLAIGLWALGTAKHWENLLRLTQGTERRFGSEQSL